MKQTAIYHSITDYIEAKERWTNTPAVIKPTGELLMIVNGRQVPKKEFDAANPKPNYEPMSGESLNGEVKGTLYGVKNVNK